MGVQLGGLGALAPSRKSDMSKIVFRAMIAGNVACFMTACIAGRKFTYIQKATSSHVLNTNLWTLAFFRLKFEYSDKAF